MIAIFLAPIYYGLLIFELIKQIKYLKENKNLSYKIIGIIIVIIVLIIDALTIPIGFLLPNCLFKRILTKIGNYWLGISLYLLISIGISDLIRLIVHKIKKDKYNLKLSRKISNAFVIIFTLSMSLYGIINAHDLKIKTYNLTSNKSSAIDSLNIVLISDLHLGYSVGVDETRDMVNKINDLKPDLVVLTGDIFDNEYEALDDPKALEKLLSSIESRYGNYAIYGNHDIEEKILCGFTFSLKDKTQVTISNEMDEFIQNSNFTILYDDYVEIKDDNNQTICYIYGRPDYEKPNFNHSSRKAASEITNELNLNNYIICLDHEPREQEELNKAGVDLDLCGHTHNGQVWPGTYTIKLIWDNAYGLKEYGNMINIVTSGVGLFGPNMRTGCDAEIVNINIKFN